MKRILLTLAATASAFAMAPAANAAIFIGISVNGGAISTVATDLGTGSANYNTTTGGYFYNVSATGFPLLVRPQLITQSVNIQSAGGSNAVIDVYITQTDLTTFTGGLLSTFTSNTISGLNAQLTSLYSTSNAVFTGTQLQTAGFTNTGMFSAGNALGTVTGPWSETVRYTLNFTGGNGSNFNGTANLTAVPEPATWAMLMLGFGALGGMLRTRRGAARIRFA